MEKVEDIVEPVDGDEEHVLSDGRRDPPAGAGPGAWPRTRAATLQGG